MRTKYGETFSEMVKVKGIECEFYDIRIDRDSVPKEKYFYEVRHDDEDWSYPCQVAEGILVNFYGTLIADQPMPLDENGKLQLGDDDFEYIYV